MGEHQHLPSPQPLGAFLPFPHWSNIGQWLQSLGDIQNPHHDLAYLLVHVGNTREETQYGVSLVWVSPHQARTPTMEEVVEKLATCTSNGSDWPYILAQLYEGSDHAPLP